MKYIMNGFANTIGWVGVSLFAIGLFTIGGFLIYLSDGIRR